MEAHKWNYLGKQSDDEASEAPHPARSHWRRAKIDARINERIDGEAERGKRQIVDESVQREDKTMNIYGIQRILFYKKYCDAAKAAERE